MKMIEVSFQMHFGEDNLLEVEAKVSPVIPAKAASLNHPGDPAEGGDVEITACYLIGEDDVKVKFEPDGLYIRPFAKFEHKLLTDDIEERAYEEANNF